MTRHATYQAALERICYSKACYVKCLILFNTFKKQSCLQSICRKRPRHNKTTQNKFHELLLCLHVGYSRASLWILHPHDKMWLNMTPFPQPTAPLHNATAQSVSIIFSTACRKALLSMQEVSHSIRTGRPCSGDSRWLKTTPGLKGTLKLKVNLLNFKRPQPEHFQ